MKKIYKISVLALLICSVFFTTPGAFSQVKRTQIFTVSAGNNDAEEAVPGGSGSAGAMDLTSSDLEIMLDGTRKQIIGVRFNNITVPNGAVIQRAFVQFANKGDKTPVLGNAYLTAEASDNAPVFTTAAFNISSRTQIDDSVLWAGSTSSTWGTTAAGVAGAEQRTPDIKTVLQPVFNRAGWSSGNALVVLIKGEGVRNAYSFDGSGGDVSIMPKLIIEYTSAAATLPLTTNFPVTSNSEWKYLDDGTDQGSLWRNQSFNDSSWSAGFGKLGYSDNAVTTLSFGPNSSNKYITYYFRKKFMVSNAAALLDTLKLSLLRDDGAIVYINGTEVVRSNMPAGAVTYQTFSSTIVDGADESTYFTYQFPKSALVTGVNTIAVEIHQRDGTSSDLGFDLSLTEFTPGIISVPCNPLPATHISNFVSVLPSAQTDSLRLPATHTFQMLVQSGDPYTDTANGVTKSLFDFTGYVPIAGSSTNGYLSVNHEQGSWPAAGVSMLDVNFNSSSKLWNITKNVPVDFGIIAGTGRNCSGTVTPWNTIITCEEILPAGDANNDGFQDVGWAVEIDPASHAIMDHDNDNQPDKLWRLGRMSHENVVVSADSLTVYEGNDENPGYIFKMIADTAGKLGSGKLYVLKLTGTVDNSSTGSWILVPNTTPAECNNVRAFAASVMATNFNSIEDVEISPKDGKVYFVSKTSSRVYRFKDNGLTVNAFDIFAGNASSLYSINYGTGTAAEQWRDGNDNLTFDNEGNLYVLQDGGRNHIWMIKPCHTAADPKIELFAVTPAGSEPTGMTFSPDYRFMFVSFQHPSGSNATQMTDAAGNPVRFNKESAVVIARKEFLGTGVTLPITFTAFNAYKSTNNSTQLEWQYYTTEAIANFNIQRMAPGGNFETIATVNVPVQGARSGKHTFTDNNPYAGKNLYRISAIQKDGKEVFTGIRIVNIDAANHLQIVNTYPNPANEKYTIVLSSPLEVTADVQVFSAGGIQVLQQRTAIAKGVNTVSLQTGSLTAGVYVVLIKTPTETLKSKLVIQ